MLGAPFAVSVLWFALNIISKFMLLLSCPEAERKENARRQAGMRLSDRPAVELPWLCAGTALVSLLNLPKQLSTLQASQQVLMIWFVTDVVLLILQT